jgi:hypothetical protein
MQLTRTVGPNVAASPFVRLLTPAFAAPYTSSAGDGRCDATDETKMIEPPLPAAMRVPTSAASRNGLFRFTAITLS